MSLGGWVVDCGERWGTPRGIAINISSFSSCNCDYVWLFLKLTLFFIFLYLLSTFSHLLELEIAASWWSSVCGKMHSWTRYRLIHWLLSVKLSRPDRTRNVHFRQVICQRDNNKLCKWYFRLYEYDFYQYDFSHTVYPVQWICCSANADFVYWILRQHDLITIIKYTL